MASSRPVRCGLGAGRLADCLEPARSFSSSGFFPRCLSPLGRADSLSRFARLWSLLPGTRRPTLRLAGPAHASRPASRSPDGWGRRLVNIWKWIAIAALVFLLVPFLARQVQQALYPQLEFVDAVQPLSSQRFEAVDVQGARRPRQPTKPARKRPRPAVSPRQSPTAISCMSRMPASRRGPVSPTGRGEWRPLDGMDRCWPRRRFVQSSFRFVERALTVLRSALLALAYILLNARRARPLIFGRSARAGISPSFLPGRHFPDRHSCPIKR